MADCKGLPTTIDIGGEIIYLDGTSANMTFAFKGREYFQKTFNPKENDECILRKYMYHSLESKKNLTFSETDKKRLKEILEARKKTLWTSIQTPSNTVTKNNLIRYYRGITKFLNEIVDNKPSPDAVPYEQCENERKVLEDIKDKEDRIMRMLLQVTWYLMHPDKVPNDIQCDWAKMVAQLEENLTVAGVQKTLVLPNSATKKGLNYFKQIDLKEFGKEATQKRAFAKAKNMITTDTSKDVMKNRLQQIMTLLSLKNYVKGSEPSEKNIAAMADKLPSKLVDIGLPLQEAFLPMKSFLKSTYDPVYSLLEKRTLTTSESLMAILLILLHICNTLPKSEAMYGVYRINGVPKEGLDWVKTQLWNPAPADATKEIHAKRMYHLSKLSLPIFTDEEGSLATIGTTIKSTPYFQFGMMGTNLKVKEPPHADINTLFPENTLFLFVTKSESVVSFKDTHTNIPANFYSIDYPTVNLQNTTLTVTPITTSIPKETKVDELITIDPTLACNHSNLVLSIFFLLESRLSTKKKTGTPDTPFWRQDTPPEQKSSKKMPTESPTKSPPAAVPTESPPAKVATKSPPTAKVATKSPPAAAVPTVPPPAAAVPTGPPIAPPLLSSFSEPLPGTA